MTFLKYESNKYNRYGIFHPYINQYNFWLKVVDIEVIMLEFLFMIVAILDS